MREARVRVQLQTTGCAYHKPAIAHNDKHFVMKPCCDKFRFFVHLWNVLHHDYLHRWKIFMTDDKEKEHRDILRWAEYQLCMRD